MWTKLAKLHCSEAFSKIWSHFHLSREIALNGKYLSHFFPDCKVLWMTLKELFEIFIIFNMFDCIATIFAYLHASSSTLGSFWVRKLKNKIENLPVFGSNRLRVLV